MRHTALLPDARTWPELWQRTASASRRGLLLDFDGTLAPFSADRDAARVSQRVGRLLAAIAGGGASALAIVSGRRLIELEERFAGLGAYLVGEHGWDEKLPRGARRRHQPSARARDLLDSAAAELARGVPPGRLEVKSASLVLHTRGEPPERVQEVGRALDACRLRLRHFAELEIRAIDGGWELRARGRNKGSAVAAIAAELGPAFLVYLGDDETDEDAFAAIAAIGFGVRVGRDDRPTRAHARLPDVAAVEEFLELWATRFAARPSEARP